MYFVEILCIFTTQYTKNYNTYFKQVKPLNYLQNIEKTGNLSFVATSWQRRLKNLKNAV